MLIDCSLADANLVRLVQKITIQMVVTTAVQELDKAGRPEGIPFKKVYQTSSPLLASRFHNRPSQTLYQLLTINFMILALSSYGRERVTSMP